MTDRNSLYASLLQFHCIYSSFTMDSSILSLCTLSSSFLIPPHTYPTYIILVGELPGDNGRFRIPPQILAQRGLQCKGQNMLYCFLCSCGDAHAILEACRPHSVVLGDCMVIGTNSGWKNARNAS